MQKLKNSYQLARMSLSIINNDLRLLGVQILGIVISLLAVVGLGLLLHKAEYLNELLAEEVTTLPAPVIAAFVLSYFIFITINHLTEALSVHLALGQIRNSKKTLGSAFTSIGNNLGGLLQFSALSATVGVALKALEDRLPWFGSIATTLTQGAWNIATPFAIPHLIDGDATSGIDATRKSVSTFKNAFGENMLVRGGAGTFMVLTILFWIAVMIMALPIFAAMYLGNLVALSIFGIGMTGLVMLTLVYAAMSSVLTSLLYEYAKNGNSLSTIDKEVFKSMLTPKKARSVFSN